MDSDLAHNSVVWRDKITEAICNYYTLIFLTSKSEISDFLE